MRHSDFDADSTSMGPSGRERGVVEVFDRTSTLGGASWGWHGACVGDGSSFKETLMKIFIGLTSTLLFFVSLSPLGCTSETLREPPPTAEEREQRAQLYDELQKAGAVSVQCNKGDFICCHCAGGACCENP